MEYACQCSPRMAFCPCKRALLDILPCAAAAGGSRAAGASLLARLHELGAAEEELAGHAAALADAQTRLAGLAAAAKEHAQCVPALTSTQTALESLTPCMRPLHAQFLCQMIPRACACACAQHAFSPCAPHTNNGDARKGRAKGVQLTHALRPSSTGVVSHLMGIGHTMPVQAAARGGSEGARPGPAARAHRGQRERAAGDRCRRAGGRPGGCQEGGRRRKKAEGRRGRLRQGRLLVLS